MVKNKAEIARNKRSLVEDDFEETQEPCPACGCGLWEREEINSIGEGFYGITAMLTRECPCCGWRVLVYEG